MRFINDITGCVLGMSIPPNKIGGGVLNLKISIVVDVLPSSCGDCPLRVSEYCEIKGLKTGSSFVDRCSDKRDDDCPLTTLEGGIV
jgi:hypothetical protein